VASAGTAPDILVQRRAEGAGDVRCAPRPPIEESMAKHPLKNSGGVPVRMLHGPRTRFSRQDRPPRRILVQRARFYETACAAIEAAVQGIDDARARRRAEREAILCTLERFGLVTYPRSRARSMPKSGTTFVSLTHTIRVCPRAKRETIAQRAPR